MAKPVDLPSFFGEVEQLAPEAREIARAESTLLLGQVVLDLRTFDLHGPVGSVLLTATEFRLLRSLAGRRGEPVHPMELLEEHWSGHALGGLALVRVHIGNLRKKLAQAAGENFVLLRTIPRKGYLLLPEEHGGGAAGSDAESQVPWAVSHASFLAGSSRLRETAQ